MLTKDEEAFIELMELAIDWNLYLPEEYFQRYYKIIEREESEVKQMEKIKKPDEVISDLRAVQEWFTEHGSNTNTGVIAIAEDTINFINEQEKELESLRKGVNIELDNFASEYDSKIKAEAVREFKQCFVCRLKQHFKEVYKEGFYKTLENQIDRILKDMESENNANRN